MLSIFVGWCGYLFSPQSRCSGPAWRLYEHVPWLVLVSLYVAVRGGLADLKMIYSAPKGRTDRLQQDFDQACVSAMHRKKRVEGNTHERKLACRTRLFCSKKKNWALERVKSAAGIAGSGTQPPAHVNDTLPDLIYTQRTPTVVIS